MEAAALMEALLDLASEAGLEVRTASGSGMEPLPPSAVCRVKGEPWVVLSTADPVEVQLDVLAGALREHAGGLLDRRFLPPAVRARLGEA